MTTKKLCCGESTDVIVPFRIHTGTVAVSGFYGHSKHLRYRHEIRGSKQIDAKELERNSQFQQTSSTTWNSSPLNIFVMINKATCGSPSKKLGGNK